MVVPDLSIVILVFNNASVLDELTTRVMESAGQVTGEFELVFVDDASKDNSWNTIQHIHSAFPGQVKSIRHDFNKGQFQALFSGLQMSTGQYVATLDGDLEKPPEAIPNLFQKIKSEQLDVVYANYPKAKGKWWLNLLANLGHWMIRTLLGISDNGSNYRIIDRRLVDIANRCEARWIFLDTLLMRHSHRKKVGFIEIKEKRTAHSNKGSGYTLSGYIKFMQLFFKSYFYLRFNRKPRNTKL